MTCLRGFAWMFAMALLLAVPAESGAASSNGVGFEGGNYTLELNGTHPQFKYRKGSFSLDTVACSGSVTAGSWDHVAAVFESAVSARIYLNGNLCGTLATSLTGVDASQTSPLKIGTGGNAAFGGDIDEVAIYGWALPIARIQTHAGMGG